MRIRNFSRLGSVSALPFPSDEPAPCEMPSAFHEPWCCLPCYLSEAFVGLESKTASLTGQG